MPNYDRYKLIDCTPPSDAHSRSQTRILWITQMDDEGKNDIEIVKLIVSVGTFVALKKVFRTARRRLKPRAVLVSHMLDNTSMTNENPILLTPQEASAMLKFLFPRSGLVSRALRGVK